MVAFSNYGLVQEDLDELASAWQDGGAQLSFDVTLNYGRCAVDGCRAMAFVGLRTQRGPRPICLKHYTILELPQAG